MSKIIEYSVFDPQGFLKDEDDVIDLMVNLLHSTIGCYKVVDASLKSSRVFLTLELLPGTSAHVSENYVFSDEIAEIDMHRYVTLVKI